MEIGYRNSWGTVRLLDHAVMTLAGASLSVGDNENGNGLLEILDGSTLRHDWIEVGDNSARGTVHVAGGSLLATANWATVGDNNGLGTLTVSGATSRWTVGNHFTVGDNRARGTVTLADGASLTGGNWAQIGSNAGRGVLNLTDGTTAAFASWIDIGINDGSDGRVPSATRSS
jgi:T5SS/PEP-CTERM-associated repeat protein